MDATPRHPWITMIDALPMPEHGFAMPQTDRADTLAGRVRLARKRKGLTQSELARASGVETLAVSNIERGITRSPRSDTIAAIAEAIECTVDWLLYGDTRESHVVAIDVDETVESVIAGEHATEDEARVLREMNWRAVGDYDYDFVRDFLTRMRLQAKLGGGPDAELISPRPGSAPRQRRTGKSN